MRCDEKKKKKKKTRSTTMRRRRDEAPSCDALLDGSRRDERERHVVERERRVYCVFMRARKEDIQNFSRSIIIRDSNQKEKIRAAYVCFARFWCEKKNV